MVIPSGDVIVMPPPPLPRREENVQAPEAPSTSTLSPVRADIPPPEQFPLPRTGSAIPVLGCTREEPVAPNLEDHHGGAQDSAPEREEDVGASNMGADIEITVSSEQATAQPTPPPEQVPPTSEKPTPAPSLPKPATPTPTKSATPPAKSPLATTSSPSSSSAPTTTVPAPVKAKPQQVLGGKKKKITVRKKSVDAQTLAQAAPSSTSAGDAVHQLTLHTAKAASAVAIRTAPRLGQVLTRTQSGGSLGSLGGLATSWNEADLGDVTSGLTRDRQLIVDPAGPSTQADKMLRWQRAMKELDSAWWDANAAYVEHRNMSNAHKSLQLQYEKYRVEAKNLPALKELEVKLNAAQEEKTEMSNMLGKLKESNDERDLELQQQKDEISRLKAELEALKEAKSKEVTDISSSCSKEIEEARKFYEDHCAKEVAKTN
ncbi:hypothetical protein ACQ4PT_022374 [Festuca glaucescens]